MFKILIIEDDKDLSRTMCTYLSHNGYEATSVTNAEDAYLEMYETVYDLVISDIMLPGDDGYKIADTIRSTNPDLPILFVTARDDFFSKQKGFLAGIDDYMVKPIVFEELLLRIGAVLRRSKIACSRKLVVGKLVMNMDERTTKLNGEDIPMTAREFNILYKLLSYPQKTFTRTQLMEEFWESGTTSGPRTVDVYMTKLRERFRDCDDFEILTVHGLGYKVVIK